MLLRIGNTTINMDLVKKINDQGERMEVSFAWDDVMPLVGNDANSLRSWLDANATNLTPKTEMDEEWEAYKSKGGDMSRGAFESCILELRELNRQMDEIGMDKSHKWGGRLDRAGRLEERLLY